MVLAYLFHANDFELDKSPNLARPAVNNPSLFSILKEAGYETSFLCISAFEKTHMLPNFTSTIPPAWTTDDFSRLFCEFEKRTTSLPFAIFFWNLISHVEHSDALSGYAKGMDDLLGGACAVADHSVGRMLDILEKKDLLKETAIIIYGDHGDDYWTHGFKTGLLHATEPFTQIVHTPLIIRDSSLQAGTDKRLASTIDIAPTALELLGFAPEFPFPQSGLSLIGSDGRSTAFSQNFTAVQPDNHALGVRKTFAAINRSHVLLVNSRGLQFYNHRLDPTNHCNILHFFDMEKDGSLIFSTPQMKYHAHFQYTMRPMLEEKGTAGADFQSLHKALKEHLKRKQEYVDAFGHGQENTLDTACLNTINRAGRAQFFGNDP